MPGDVNQVVPYSLKDTPSLIEHVFPAQKMSAEAQKERKANAGQTLTSLGSYWKGRKPLVLVRACVLGALLPATDHPETDLAVFERLMLIDDAAFQRRAKKRGSWPDILQKPYLERLKGSFRPEEVEDALDATTWEFINGHLGTTARSLPELVRQLGVMRFGHAPQVADTFSGGGSIPFEAARVGCDVYASDLNPVACLLTWGALNIIGASEELQSSLDAEYQRIVAAVGAEILSLEIESDSSGNRAKAYLYCLETRCPKTGWLVPLAPSWVISVSRRTVAKLVPIPAERRFEILVESGVTDDEMETASRGTIRGSCLEYVLDGEVHSTPIRTIRENGGAGLRPWTADDIWPAPGDVFQERLYCIQWIAGESLDAPRQRTYFAAPTPEDEQREARVRNLVGSNLRAWQKEGLAPDMEIVSGDNTDQLFRERGWTHWHHLFTPRDLATLSIWKKHATTPVSYVYLAMLLDFSSRLCQWLTSAARHEEGGEGKQVGGPRDLPNHVFYNQALNSFFNYAIRSGYFQQRAVAGRSVKCRPISGQIRGIQSRDARALDLRSDLYITDPPYADAVNYHEITEFFVSWLRRNPPSEFADWTWDTRRRLAIRGDGQDFRLGMVEAYSAMVNHMPDNGLQIVMFTHQSGEVWADMAQIFWGAGLQVMAAWYIATETTSELKKGGYVQGTVILVLRKRKANDAGYRDEIVQEIKAEVARQIDTMVGLNQSLKGHGRIQNLFEDADLQMAGYAAALRVLTAYARIDGTDMTREALRPRKKGEQSLVADIIEFAVQVANEHLVPDGMDPRVWERLSGAERFYLKMLDIETTGAKKLDNYQNFAKAFRVPNYTELMQSLKPNDARLRNAVQFKKAGFDDGEFGRSPTRAALFALYELQAEIDGDTVVGHLRDLVDGYTQQRDTLAAVTSYIALKRQGIDAAEAQAARILHGIIRNERLGA